MEILTYSRMRMYLNCPASEQLRYIACLVPKMKGSTPRLLGSAVHKGLETGSTDEAMALFDSVVPVSQEEQDQLDADRATCRAMLLGAEKAFSALDEMQPEVEFCIPIINPKTGDASPHFMLAGKVDGICSRDGETWLVEYKTASTISKQYVDRLCLDGQVTTYIYAMQRVLGRPIAGVIYRVIRKPSIRKCQGETADQFCSRLEAEYQNRPEFYYVEQLLYRNPNDIRAFEQELWDITQRMLWDRQQGICLHNTARCTDYGCCDYMPICRHDQWQPLYEHCEPHQELTIGGKTNAVT